jgi:hypothetical protein
MFVATYSNEDFCGTTFFFAPIVEKTILLQKRILCSNFCGKQAKLYVIAAKHTFAAQPSSLLLLLKNLILLQKCISCSNFCGKQEKLHVIAAKPTFAAQPSSSIILLKIQILLQKCFSYSY